MATTEAQGIVTTEDDDSGPDRQHHIAIDDLIQSAETDDWLLCDGLRAALEALCRSARKRIANRTPPIPTVALGWRSTWPMR